MARWWRGEKASSSDKSEARRACHAGSDNLVTTVPKAQKEGKRSPWQPEHEGHRVPSHRQREESHDRQKTWTCDPRCRRGTNATRGPKGYRDPGNPWAREEPRQTRALAAGRGEPGA